MRVFKATVLCDKDKNDTRCERLIAQDIEAATDQVAAMLKVSMLPVESVTIEDIHQTPFMWRSIATGNRA
jgi:hypothetical protein